MDNKQTDILTDRYADDSTVHPYCTHNRYDIHRQSELFNAVLCTTAVHCDIGKHTELLFSIYTLLNAVDKLQKFFIHTLKLESGFNEPTD